MVIGENFFIIQEFIFQNFQFGTSESLYYRTNDRVNTLPSREKFLFNKGGKIWFDTYFNALTIHKWKKYCRVDRLFLNMEGKGRFIVRFCMHQQGKHSTILAENVVEIDQHVNLEINSWKELQEGLLFLELISLEDNGEISKIAFLTDTKPNQDVKLGMVITHFNRKQWVLPAVKRLNEQLFIDPYYQNKIHLVIVDNSKNLNIDEVGNTTLLPNRNLGGSGGFTRGLLYLKDSNQDYTHCLFMDDDASCEVESIRRTYNFISFLNDDHQDITIAGALMRDLHPSIIFEKGAKFPRNKLAIPLHQNLNMDLVEHLLIAEDEAMKPNYGAWWFFCFPIKEVKYYPFPFFVKGDDMLFSLTNKFNILTLNGISCWGEDFASKSSPMAWYLINRAEAINSIIFHNANKKRAKWLYHISFMDSLYSMNYESCQAILLAMKDFLAGPKFFIDNLDTQEIRKKIKEITVNENMSKLDIDHSSLIHRSNHFHKEKRIHKIIRQLTLNGILLPSCLMKSGMVYQPKSYAANPRQVFKYKKVYYENFSTHEGYITEFNRSKALNLLKEYIKISFLFNKKFASVKKEYQEKFDYMTSENFWRDIYK